MGRGRIAGAPTPDIWGRKAGRGRRLQAYGYAPAVRVRGRVAGGPTPDIYRFWGHAMGPAPQGYAPALQGGAVNIAGGPTPDI
eukprot:gene21641-biopygen4152